MEQQIKRLEITQVIIKTSEKSYWKFKKILKFSLKLNKCWYIKLKKHDHGRKGRKKKKANPSEFFETGLIF
jgi:hypothetical protein